MAKVSPAITSFNGGEFSPLLKARVDQEKYPNGAEVLENFIPTVQGPIKKRGGTRFLAQTKNGQKVMLIPFQYSVDVTYVIELGDRYARFYTTDPETGERGLLVDEEGNPFEVETPYRLSDIFAPDGSSRIQYAQSGDVVYLCCAKFPVMVLKRVSASKFEVEAFKHKHGPVDDINTTPTVVRVTGGAAGYVRITASSDIFKEGHIGSWFYVEAETFLVPWEVDTPIWEGNNCRSDGKNYRSLTWAYTGTVPPTHTKGTAWDGRTQIITTSMPWKTVGVNWLYTDSNYVYLKIERFINARTVEAIVAEGMSVPAEAWNRNTKLWAFGAWNEVSGYPTSVAFFRSRLWFARGQRLWASVSSAFDDFAMRNHGEITADMGISVKLASGQVNDIQWLLPDKNLIAGTAGGEFAIGELSNGSALGPENIRAVLQSEYGSKQVQPVKNGSAILFMQRAGLKARELFYSISNEGYMSTDATLYSEHITSGEGVLVGGKKYYGITSMTVSQEPDPIIWMTRTDGKLVGFTWDNEQEVKCWHRHDVGGFVESITSLPSADGKREELWMCVRRSVNGKERYYIEYMADTFHFADDAAEQYYLDCGLTYREQEVRGKRMAISTIQGLEHLEGQEVVILADGAVLPPQIVHYGRIDLDEPAKVVHVGLPFAARYKSLRVEAGAADGIAQGKTKRIHRVTLRLDQTGDCKAGPDVDKLSAVLMRKRSDHMNQPAPLFTGDYAIDWDGDYDAQGQIAFVSDEPVAATLVGIFPQLLTQDR